MGMGVDLAVQCGSQLPSEKSKWWRSSKCGPEYRCHFSLHEQLPTEFDAVLTSLLSEIQHWFSSVREMDWCYSFYITHNIHAIELHNPNLASFPLLSLSEQQCRVDALNGSLQPTLSTCGVFQISSWSSVPKMGLCELCHGWICCKLVVFPLLFKKDRAL